MAQQRRPEEIESLVQTNLSRLIANDPWLRQATEFSTATVRNESLAPMPT
jgi:hypothetical protein